MESITAINNTLINKGKKMILGLTNEIKSNMLRFFLNVPMDPQFVPTPVFAGLLVDQNGPEPEELIIGDAGYNRVEVSFAVIDGIAKNVSSITFNKATQDWTPGTDKITHVAFFTSHYDEDLSSYVSDTTDTLIAVLPLLEKETVLAGETFQLNPQAVKMQLV